MGIFDKIGRGFKNAGNWIGNEVGRVVAPIGSAIEGDWRGAASGIGRNIKRAGQAGALFGKDKLAGIDVDVLGAGGGAIEGGLGPSDLGREYWGDTGDGGFAGALGGAAKGYGGVQAGKGLHNIGERLGVNRRLGAFTNKVGITSPDPSVRLEGETDEAFVDRVQGLKYDEEMNKQYGADYEWDPSLSAEQNYDNKSFARDKGRFLGAARVRMEDPRTIKIGEQYFGGPGGPGDLSPGSAGSNFIDQAIGENTERLDKWNRDLHNVPNVDPQTGMGLGARPPQAPQAISAPSVPSMPALNLEAQYSPSEYMTPPRPQAPQAMAEAERSRAIQSQGDANRSLMSPMSSPTPTSLNGTDRRAMAEAERSRAIQSQGGRAVQDIRDQFTTTPSAPNLGDYSVPEDANPQSSWMTPPSGYTDLKGIGGRFAETGFQGPRNPSGVRNDPRSLWRKAGDYIGDNPDVVVNALGQAIGGFAQSGLADRQVAVDERMMDLREQQAAYEQDRERLREQFLLRGSTSRWA